MITRLFLLTIISGFILGLFSVSNAGDKGAGISIYSEPGTYNATPLPDWKVAGEIIFDSQPEGQEVLSRPFPDRSETPVFVAGNTVLLPVRLGYQKKELSTWLVFDTGATTTTLHRSVGDRLGIIYDAAGKITIADGTVIDSHEAVLDYIIVGPYRMDNFHALFINHKKDSGKNRVQGLLGMNFLRKVNYRIDFTRKKIRWTDK